MRSHGARTRTRARASAQAACEGLCGCGAAPATAHAHARNTLASAHGTAMAAPPLRQRLRLPLRLPLALPVCLLLGAALLCPPGSGAFAADGPQQMYPGLSADDYEVMRNSLRELEADALRRALLRDLQEQAMEEAAAAVAAAARSSSREEPLPLPLALPAGAGAGPGPAAERLPVPLPLVRAAYGGAGPDLSKEEPPVKKMKSYSMSLCLFKICNMGRKRTNRS